MFCSFTHIGLTHILSYLLLSTSYFMILWYCFFFNVQIFFTSTYKYNLFWHIALVSWTLLNLLIGFSRFHHFFCIQNYAILRYKIMPSKIMPYFFFSNVDAFPLFSFPPPFLPPIFPSFFPSFLFLSILSLCLFLLPSPSPSPYPLS